MDFQVGFNIVVGLAGGLMGWVLKTITDRMDSLTSADRSLTEKVQAIEVLVAGQYIKRNELEKHIDNIFVVLRRIEEKLDGKMDK
jgi:hypothetical protein